MATVTNERELRLQATSPRTLPVTLPSNVTYNGDVTGNVSGTVNFVGAGSIATGSGHGNAINGGTGSIGSNTTLDGIIASIVRIGADRGSDIFNGVGSVGFGTSIGGLGQTSLRNSSISLSSFGSLLDAGGGTMTNGSGLSSLNASNMSSGIISSGRFGTSTIDATKLSVGSLSAITANIGVISSGTITSSTNINVTGQGNFNGVSSGGGFNAAVNANSSFNATNGVAGMAASGSGAGVVGWTFGSGPGVRAGGSYAFSCQGQMTMTSSLLVSNMFVAQANVSNSTNFVSGGNVSGVVAGSNNTNNMLNLSGASYLRGHATDVGSTSSVSAHGTGIITGSGLGTVRTRASGINVIIEDPSDIRLKKDMNPITNGLEFVLGLKPITFRFKKNSEIQYGDACEPLTVEQDDKLVHGGFRAQDVEALINDPNNSLVQTGDNGMLTLDKPGLIPYLVDAIHTLNDKVVFLENELKRKKKL